MTSNIAESLNSTNKEARDLPVTTLLSCLHGLVQERSVQNRKIATYTMTILTEKEQEMMRNNYSNSTKMVVR